MICGLVDINQILKDLFGIEALLCFRLFAFVVIRAERAVESVNHRSNIPSCISMSSSTSSAIPSIQFSKR
jgi:hypothetical protein